MEILSNWLLSTSHFAGYDSQHAIILSMILNMWLEQIIVQSGTIQIATCCWFDLFLNKERDNHNQKGWTNYWKGWGIAWRATVSWWNIRWITFNAFFILNPIQMIHDLEKSKCNISYIILRVMTDTVLHHVTSFLQFYRYFHFRILFESFDFWLEQMHYRFPNLFMKLFLSYLTFIILPLLLWYGWYLKVRVLEFIISVEQKVTW